MRGYVPASRTPQALLFVLPLFVAGCSGSPEGDVVPGAELGSVVVTQWNDSTELFLEYPHLVAGRHTGNWAIHLTDLDDFAPIRSGTLTVSFAGVDGGVEAFDLEAPARDGIFLLDPAVERSGTYRVELALESPQTTSRHVLPDVTVYPTLAEAPLADSEEEGGGIAFLKEQQWVIPFQVLRAEEGDVQATVSAPGEIVPPDGALVQVTAPVEGIAPPAANVAAPSVGERVSMGQVLAVLAPTTAAGGIAEAQGRVGRLRREVERTEGLYDVGAVPQRRLEEARHELEIARAELEAMGGTDGGDDFLLRLTAPISGVVARRDLVPGGRVAAGAPLFTIVDPSAAWLRVHVPASRASSLAPGRASFTVEGSEQVQATSRLLSVGSVLDPRTRTVPVVYEVDGASAEFTFGQIASVAVPVGHTERGPLIPNEAVLDDNGTPVAFVQTSGETFERRVLTLGASDGERTRVQAGIQPGEMVVASGAYQVRLASLSGNEFAGGHAH